MKTIGPILLIIAVLVLLYLGYKFLFKDKGKEINMTGDTGDVILTPINEDYFVNGDDVHDRNVFTKGLECAKAFLYNNTTNSMANAVIASLGRGTGNTGACSGFNCAVASSIMNLTQDQKIGLLNYVNHLNVGYAKKFINLALGRRNMCSVILETAYNETGLGGTGAGAGKG